MYIVCYYFQSLFVTGILAESIRRVQVISSLREWSTDVTVVYTSTTSCSMKSKWRWDRVLDSEEGIGQITKTKRLHAQNTNIHEVERVK